MSDYCFRASLLNGIYFKFVTFIFNICIVSKKRPLARPRSRWEDNIKMDLQEVGGGRGD